ncbi:hypothetical protein TWF696_000930 [Orbilia brochopaga]|uniref:Uncharacterized protein n=1 Tax=Orbilia brochopaga TaxID=3140254 RepID=A0AAV9VFD2_9PEZI
MGHRRPAYAIDWDAMDNVPGGDEGATNQYILTKQQECQEQCRCATQKQAIGPEGEANKLLCPTFAMANFCERIVGCYCYVQYKPKKDKDKKTLEHEGISKLLDSFEPGEQRTDLNYRESVLRDRGNRASQYSYYGGYGGYEHANRIQVAGANEPYYIEGPDMWSTREQAHWNLVGNMHLGLLGGGSFLSGIFKRDADAGPCVSAAEGNPTEGSKDSCDGSSSRLGRDTTTN